MATNISNSVLCDEIDFIAAVAKAMATIYTATYDAYDFMVREQNPDDLINGVDAAIAVRDKLEAGTGVYTQFSNMTQWLGTRASAAGSSGLDALLTARGQRAPYSYDQYVYYPSANAHMSARNIFYDTEAEMAEFAYTSDVFSGGAALIVSGSHNWVVVQTQGAIGSAWVVSAPVNYGDGSTGTEVISYAGTEASGATQNIGSKPVKGISEAGTFNVTFETGVSGMVAGQYVLFVDNTYPVMLSANVPTGAKTINVAPDQIGWYTPGDDIWISDNVRRETGTVENINYEYGTVTLETATTKWYLTSAQAYINKATGTGDGFQEQHVVAQISGTDISFSGALQHSYGTGGYGIRLIRKVLDAETTSGGSAGYAITFKTKSERTVGQ